MPRAFRSTPFNFLVGKTLTRLDGATQYSEEITMECSTGERYRMYHEQDCCENVKLEEIIGDVADLVGSPIIEADVSTSHNEETGEDAGYSDSSHTWTFYRLGTARGFVTLRWLGQSNGYYSEGVTFESTLPEPPPMPAIEAEDL